MYKIWCGNPKLSNEKSMSLKGHLITLPITTYIIVGVCVVVEGGLARKIVVLAIFKIDHLITYYIL